MIKTRTSPLVPKTKSNFKFAAALLAAAALAFQVSASVPVPEKLLPDDTLLVLSAPDFSKVRDIFKASAQNQLWNDPAMKPFKDNFLTKWKEQVTDPLERELDLKLEDYASFPQGQVTFALIQNGWHGRDEDSLGKVLVIDTKDKSAQLKSNLAKLRKKWVDSGKSLRTEKIRDTEFMILPLSSNDVPQAIRAFVPQKPEVQELGADNEPVKKPEGKKGELVIGQADSLLILADSTKTAEKILSRAGGGSAPVLADLAAFQGNQTTVFRDAPIFGWINLKTMIELFSKASTEKKESDAAPDPFAGPKPEKALAAIGGSGLRTLAFAARNSPEGTSLHLFLGAPESSRGGIFKIIAGESKETSVPPFIPGDAVKFQRWRLDGQKVWATLEKILNDLSPQAGNTINMLLDMANASAKEKDPGFDVRKNLIGNLGDDMITYKKAPQGTTPDQVAAPPGIFLLGSPNPEQLVAALRSIFGMTGSASGAPTEREFLGRKIYSTAMPSLPLPGAGGPPGKTRPLQYAATSSYVAMSTDSSMIEEFLRSSESQSKKLRETAGLSEAAQKVTGPGTGLFGFENQAETMKATFEMLRKNPQAATNNTASGSSLNPLSSAVNVGNAEKNVKDLMDFSLLPPFEKIAKYFYITVYGVSATSEGLNLKFFAPTPPAVKAR